MGILAELEGPDPMRLEVVLPPDAVHGHARGTLSFRHGAHTPVGRMRGLAMKGRLYDRLLLLGGDLRGAPRPGGIIA